MAKKISGSLDDDFGLEENLLEFERIADPTYPLAN